VVIGVLVGSILAVMQLPRPSPTPLGKATVDAGSPSPPATGTPGSTISPASSTSSTAPSASASIPIDPSLLGVLPAEVGGLPLTEDPATEATDAADPAHTVDLAALARGIVADPASGNLSVASVVRLKQGVYTDAYYRSWRDTFDEGVCSRAGGVAGSAESTIAGRTVFIGHCNQGVLTYHVYLAERGLIASIMSLGDKRLGEQLVRGIR
jgi:hypothetical protein